ncbi:4Fe-4S cluster-binding domain-containing protein [Chitinasiproducens palmae]|uniref:Anaerobic ribonucleoside-triphosphate reductase activating protein n=1 Tax=Chitinasiproducens palmae TaxID=1770053 RepID=A0A1H2PQ97_9BURK|nr:4Fe-4S cluster-binding domain-containing protein [Chitinasiproducens palmae]SDV48915.1 anaerobic ribonucleoside-triphosphate reductase activating protein [Chitinasiproducens palmae]
MDIRLSRLHFPVTTLGPGQRIGIWLQGCSIRCPGCISADTWSEHGRMTRVADVLAQLDSWLPHASGVTVSGGEPFDQPEALLALLAALRAAPGAAQRDVLVYSGHPIESIAATLARAEGLIDALVSDPFEIDTPQSLALRGSDNQRLHLLTPLGQARLASYERRRAGVDRALDAMFDDDGSVWFAGIPARGDFNRLRDLLNQQGHRVQISADKARR